jgi:hypothetical protein
MENNAITIKLNKKFYCETAIEKGISAYSELAEFETKATDDFIEITLKNIDPETKNAIKDEFCNYVLSEMKNVISKR